MNESGAVFLGRIGVLYRRPFTMLDFDQYIPFEFVPISLNRLANMGYLVCVMGNSKIDEPDAPHRSVFDRVSDMIREYTYAAIKFTTCYHGKEKCNCKFPKPALFEQIIEDFKLTPEECFMVAGTENEFKAAHAVGIQTILVKTGRKKWNDKSIENSIALTDNFETAVGMIEELSLVEEIC